MAGASHAPRRPYVTVSVCPEAGRRQVEDGRVEARAGQAVAKRCSARARRFAASTSRFFGGAFVTSASSSQAVASVTSATAVERLGVGL